ncbi:MAG TPA: ABC transporter ATP-binding protein [Pyrinomonadaceae bacterium]|nr:ABC transporter ATP-binding protein [Pyrinomonadaceae bacterium]
MNELILQTKGLTRQYGRRKVVDDLSLSVERGDIFGFLGQNGAGKSTVIRMALGLVRPTRGRVLLFAHDMGRHPLKALGRVGAIVEAPAFYENFSGYANLRMFAAMSGGAERKQIEQSLELVGLQRRGRDKVLTYSHGMRQRLGIAQALLPHPEFIILDEPTDGLDPQGIHEIRLLLPRLRDELGLTIMLSSHLLLEVERICNRVAIIDGGRLLYQGAIENLVSCERLIKITVAPLEEAYRLLSRDQTISVSRNGSNSLYLRMRDEDVPRVNALLVANKINVMELAPQRATLEEVFLTLTASGVTPFSHH